MNRVGLELELLAPPGKTRFDLARALAKQAGGALRLSFKYHGQGVLPDGRPDCHLTPAARVSLSLIGVRRKHPRTRNEPFRNWFCSVVDDPTIVDDLASAEEPLRIARTDDVRLALWIERHCAGNFEALKKTFDATEEEDGFVDPWGQPLVRWHEVSAERLRVSEVVLRPLSRKELAPTLRRVMKLADAQGFTVPAEGAIHAHFDAAPFRSTPVLRRLVLKWSEERERWLKKLEPNPRCRKLGPFPPDVVRVAKEATDDLPFSTLAAGMLLGGLHRAIDVNILGVVERYPKQPTVEVRCLPGSLDADETLERIAVVDHFLSSIQES